MQPSPLAALEQAPPEVLRILSQGRADPRHLPFLLSDAVDPWLEPLARLARHVTECHFGRTVQLYVPLYLSNACVNRCLYCGFSARNPGERVTLGPGQVQRELELVRGEGFGHVLLVTGEAPDQVGLDYLVAAVRQAKALFPSVSVEVYPLDDEGYRALVGAGADGLTIYQETYDRGLYARVHAGGPKADFDWRLGAPERGCRAGFRKVGLGALLGLGDLQPDVTALVEHVLALRARHWKTFFSLSVPRMRAARGGMRPRVQVSDRQLARLIVALRLILEDVGLVVSTREPAGLRDHLVPLGVTQMSAGSRTEPGGYSHPEAGEKQFNVEDGRTPEEVARVLAAAGYDPVWKDWDWGLGGRDSGPPKRPGG
jgi:2-iminoacetate synthase